MVIGSNYI